MNRHLKVVTILAVGFGLILYAVFAILPLLSRVESAENLPSVTWLPSSANNVSYARNYNRQYFEFDITELEFVEWANAYSLNEISKPIHVTRYTIMIDQPTALNTDVTVNPRYTATISNGLADSHTQSNHGGYSIAFDRDRKRAYFQSARR